MTGRWRRRRLLASPVAPDAYLLDVARRFPSHAFLGGATLGVYERQVALVARVLTQRLGRALAAVRVLDWGAGKGHIAHLLRAQGLAVVSCDLDRAAGDSAFGQETPILTERGYPVVPLHDPVTLPFDDGSFDAAVSFGVLEHVADERASLAELHRVLAPGGTLFVFFLPGKRSWTQRLARGRGDHYHERLYDTDDLRRLAQDAGFRLDAAWHGQLFPKNRVRLPRPLLDILEAGDRLFTELTPLRNFATNLEAVLTKE